MKNKNPHIGSSFNDFLKEQGIYEECESDAIKKFMSLKIKKAMATKNINKSEMARRMDTSRSAVERLLNPENNAITLHTMEKAASAVHMRLIVDLREADSMEIPGGYSESKGRRKGFSNRTRRGKNQVYGYVKRKEKSDKIKVL